MRLFCVKGCFIFISRDGFVFLFNCSWVKINTVLKIGQRFLNLYRPTGSDGA